MTKSANTVLIFLLTFQFTYCQSAIYSSIHINEPIEIRNKMADLVLEVEIWYRLNNTMDTISCLMELDSTNRCTKEIFSRGRKKTISLYEREENKIVNIKFEWYDEKDSLVNRQMESLVYDKNDRLLRKVTTSIDGSIISQTDFEIGDNGYPERCTSGWRVEEANYDFEKNQVNITFKDNKGRKSFDSDFVLYPKNDNKYPNSNRFYNEKGDIVFEKEDEERINYYKYVYDVYGNWVQKEMYSIELYHSPNRYMNQLILKSTREIKYKNE